MPEAYYYGEVTLFKEPKNKRMWVVEYKGNGHYFETFAAAIGYILERHDEAPETFAVIKEGNPWQSQC